MCGYNEVILEFIFPPIFSPKEVIIKEKGYRFFLIFNCLASAIAVIFAVSAFFYTEVRAEKVFSDVKQGDWYYSYVSDLAEAGAVNGYPSGEFKPDGFITRAEFTTIVLNTMGVDSIEKALRAVGGFRLESEYWAKTTIIASKYYGIANFGESRSEWDKPITRAEMAYIAIKGAEILGWQKFEITEGIEGNIADWGNISERPQSRQIKQAYSCGIINGKDSAGRFMPDDRATRAEACVVIMRLIVPTLRTVPASL